MCKKREMFKRAPPFLDQRKGEVKDKSHLAADVMSSFAVLFRLFFLFFSFLLLDLMFFFSAYFWLSEHLFVSE